MSPYEVEREILHQANEDYTGLWELAWSLSTVEPTMSHRTAVQLAREAVTRLLEQKAIEVYSMQDWHDKAPTAGMAPLIAEDAYWEPPAPGAPIVVVAATDLGERLLHAPH